MQDFLRISMRELQLQSETHPDTLTQEVLLVVDVSMQTVSCVAKCCMGSWWVHLLNRTIFSFKPLIPKKNSLSKQNTAIEQLPLLMKVRGILLAWTVRNKSLMYLIIDLKTLFCSCTEAQYLNKVFCNGSKFLLNIQSGVGNYCQC